ncbi:MAG TPA: hypothetical protein VFY73_17990 [Ideonella sp.]|uniref:hypothetical protein n=1 Tax=Ideonella sp. TaxID=1929293 RepID=UPI002E367E1F|nr:hypothetical protein [Ideonella sp.]HEX5685920.1 hypothetical protein [Ideonella sp.]
MATVAKLHRFLLTGLAGMLALVILQVWVTDCITPQGSWTLYSVHCQAGAWQGDRCGGRLVAASRYRMRIDRAASEVAVIDARTKVPAGRLTDCDIQDGRNWACRSAAPGTVAVVERLRYGRPDPTPQLPEGDRPVAKWRWMLMRAGLPAGQRA